MNDTIYLFGGGSYSEAYETASAYDPSRDEWTAIASLPHGIHGPAAAVLGSRIYLIGGVVGGQITDDVWVYDTNTDSYHQGKSLPVTIAYSKAVTIDGCIYLLGGHGVLDPEAAGVTFLRYCP